MWRCTSGDAHDEDAPEPDFPTLQGLRAHFQTPATSPDVGGRKALTNLPPQSHRPPRLHHSAYKRLPAHRLVITLRFPCSDLTCSICLHFTKPSITSIPVAYLQVLNHRCILWVLCLLLRLITHLLTYTMTITIHGAFFSTCTQRVLTTLVEKNVDDWKLESIDMMKGQHKSPEYLQNLQVSHP